MRLSKHHLDGPVGMTLKLDYWDKRWRTGTLLPTMPGYLLGPFNFCYFGLTTLSNQWGERGKLFCSVLPRGHGNIAPCQGNVGVVLLLWAVELWVLPAPYYSEVWHHLLWVLNPGILFQVCRMSIFQRWILSPHREGAWVPLLIFSRWSSRLFLTFNVFLINYTPIWYWQK